MEIEEIKARINEDNNSVELLLSDDVITEFFMRKEDGSPFDLKDAKVSFKAGNIVLEKTTAYSENSKIQVGKKPDQI